MGNLRIKLERYESKAGRCRNAAQEARDEAGRAFYEELACYYDALAADFRRVLAKRQGASLAAE